MNKVENNITIINDIQNSLPKNVSFEVYKYEKEKKLHS